MPLVLIPTYNERDNLIPLIDAVQSNLPSSHALIIDDNSPDGTGALAQGLADAEAELAAAVVVAPRS